MREAFYNQLSAEEKTALLISLEDQVIKLQAELNCFWTGDIPESATIAQHCLAKWGRKRHQLITSNT